MSSRELVIDLVNKLPENASLAEIAREIELQAGIEKGRAQARQGEGNPAEDARKLVDSWASKQSSRHSRWMICVRSFPSSHETIPNAPRLLATNLLITR